MLPPDRAPRFASCSVSQAIEARFPHVDPVNADAVLVVNQSAAGEEEGHDDREGRSGCYHCCELGTDGGPTEHDDHYPVSVFVMAEERTHFASEQLDRQASRL